MSSNRWLVGTLTLLILGAPTGADAQKRIRGTRQLPIVISESGSYELRGNIVVPDADTTAIEIVDPARDVTIDLNGFTISGPTVCTGSLSSLDCAPTGTGVGIRRSSGDLSSGAIVVTNGTITGMGASGIEVEARQVRIERLQAYSNGGHGISSIAFAGYVSGCMASGNGGVGINSSSGVVRDNIAEGNAEGGIIAEYGTVVSGNTALLNGGDGLRAFGGGNVVTGNVASSNESSGIIAVGVVSQNVVGVNGASGIDATGSVNSNASFENGGVGIFAISSSVFGNSANQNQTGIEAEGGTVVQNSASHNASYGLDLAGFGGSDASGYAMNAAKGNNGGDGNPQIDGGLETGSNVCGVDITCP